MHYLDIFSKKAKTCGTPTGVLDEEVTDGLGESVWGSITGNDRHNIFKEWGDLAGHSLSHKGPLVWKIHEGVQVKDGSDKEARLWNQL